MAILALTCAGIVAQSVESESKTVNIATKDKKTRGSSDPLSGLNVALEGQEMLIGEYHLLIIGIDSYQYWEPLQNAVNDAKEIHNTLEEKYKTDNIITLYNQEATRANIIKAFEDLRNAVSENDNVMIYFSGHGEYVGNPPKGYWVPVDSKKKSSADYISTADIKTFISEINSKHIFLIADACYSGDVFRGNTVSIPYENSERYYNTVHNKRSRSALTSGDIEKVMDAGRDGHSVFAYYLLKELNRNDKRYLDASELYNAIKIPVFNNSEQSPRFAPLKNTGDEGGQFIFIQKSALENE